ncbi:hypothetical protein, partial [Thalassospira lucentensis]|uniref:hypothetical protein n=1 Tax=Thalassospira lucentensis TaxID=168935 RepID=UPI0023F28CB0
VNLFPSRRTKSSTRPWPLVACELMDQVWVVKVMSGQAEQEMPISTIYRVRLPVLALKSEVLFAKGTA